MSLRNLSHAVCATLLLSAGLFAQNGTQYLFQLPGAASTSGQFFPYNATGNPLAPLTNAAVGPTGALQVIPKPDGSKFYVIGTPGTNMLQVADPSLVTFHNVTGLGSEKTTAAAITPDGKSLLVATDADAFYIIDTTTDNAGTTASLALPGLSDFTTVQTPCPTCWIAVSPDASTAYVLTNFAGGSQVTKFNLNTHTRTGSPLVLGSGDATSISLSPLGLLYVTGANQIVEINPATMLVTNNGVTQLAFTPGPLRFTPDGTAAFSANRTPQQAGHSVLEFTTATHAIQYWPATFSPSNPAPLIDDVLVASNTSVFAVSTAKQLLYDVAPTPLNLTSPSTLGALTGLSSLVTTVSGAVLSNELPAAKYMYLVVNNGSLYIYRVNLASNTIDTSALAALTTGTMQFAVVPPTTGAAQFLQFNADQTLPASAVSKPLIARVLNANGQPVYNVNVAFSADPASGIAIALPNQTTNADGYVATTVTMPATPGPYTVTLNANGVIATYNLTIPGGGGGGGGGTGTPSQVTIVGGDGQLVDPNTPTTDPNNPLTLLVTDTAGNPLPNVPVGFSLTSCTINLIAANNCSGNLYGSSITTDANGLASTLFSPQFNGNSGGQFETFVINATTQYGDVNFTVTEVAPVSNQNAVNFEFATSDDRNLGLTTHQVTVGQGDVLASGATATIYSNVGVATPIPGIGIRIAGPDGESMSSAAACQGSSLSDKTGKAICNVIAQCQAAGTQLPQTFQVNFRVGDFKVFPGLVTVTAGHTTQVNIASGNNQTGKAGSTLAVPLIATVTDGCQSPAQGQKVSWTVIKGGATLTNTKDTSDSRGQVSTQVVFGSSPGVVQVQVTLGTSTQVFSMTSTVVVGGVSLVSGGGQTAITGDPFTNALVFVVKDTGGNPIPGQLVTFSVTSGSAGLNPASQSTNQQGQVSTNVTAGATAGTIVITASAAGSSATATLTTAPKGPVITAASFTNADSGAIGLVPCGRATITGPGIAPNVQGSLSGVNPLSPLPYVLGGFSMTVNGVPAPIESVTNSGGVQSATFQTPCETVPGSPATVIAQGNGGTTTVSGITVFQAQPGVHSYQGSNGKTYGYILCSNGTITQTNFAQRGDTCYVIVTGLGQTNPAAKTNNAGVAGQNVVLQTVVGVNNAGVPVVSSQYLQGWNGFYIVGFTIPKDAPTGVDQPFAVVSILSDGTPKFGNPVFIPGVQ